jgi:uncharacterized membrane protein
MRSSRVALIGTVLACLFETARLWSAAPALMASHFDVSGVPNGFAPKDAFFGFQLAIILLIAGLAVGLRAILVRVPMGLINLPNREYWLAPQRRAETVERVASFTDVLFTGTLALMLSVFELAVAANLRKPPVLDSNLIWLLLAAYLVFTFGGIVWLFRAFRLPK